MSERRLLNRSAVKDFALKCSKEKRAGKFTRVGEDFLTEVEVDAEIIVREVLTKWYLEPSERVLWEEPTIFVTGELMDCMKTALNEALTRMIQRKVQRQPSCGCTLGRTR